MKKILLKLIGLLTLTYLLVGCQQQSYSEHEHEISEVKEEVILTGLADHYHTGSLVEVTASIEENVTYNDWHWYIKAEEDLEWEAVPEQHTNELIMEAPEQTISVRAVLYDENHEAYAQSSEQKIIVNNH